MSNDNHAVSVLDRCSTSIHLPPLMCQRLDQGMTREWLVTNGIGGFASGTVAGPMTRRYHGLLIAALDPPLGRTLLFSRLEEFLTIGEQTHCVFTNVWRGGAIDPEGWKHLSRFDLCDGVPTWTYDVDGARLTKRVWMEHGCNATFVEYALHPDSPPVSFAGRLLINCRDYHHLERDGRRGFDVAAHGPRLDIQAHGSADIARCFCCGFAGASLEWDVDHTWHRGTHLPVEAARGFDDSEDHLCAGTVRVELQPGETATFVMGTADCGGLTPKGAYARHESRTQVLEKEWHGNQPTVAEHPPLAIRTLVRAADQFIVARASANEPEGYTILAGYPWFTDWGRDTMIALPGLTLVTGRYEIARRILRTWAGYVERGVIPNRFPDAGDRPEYHTVDATLWYLWAIDQYVRARDDQQTLRELFPVMRDIVAWHRRGTVHNIRVGDDGLVAAGEHGVNLTWMDAKIGDCVITPRMGKPVELSALWYDACCNMAELAERLGVDGSEFAELAMTTRASFGRFWNESQLCCYDVLDGPDGDDGSVRPNQVFAVALTHCALSDEQQAAVVSACEQKLLGWFGLRTLAPDDGRYRLTYSGGPVERDEAYHQGTAWAWLLGPFVTAHYRVHRDSVRAREFLAPLLGQVWSHGVGSLSEVFDGEEPHRPDGCIAQAWSVAEMLRAWHVTQRDAPTCSDSGAQDSQANV